MAGLCERRFSAVRDAFEANLGAGLEAGAACAVTIDGRVVVDLWGGIADVDSGRRWERDTLVDCRSATKGLVALCLAILVDRGLVDLDAGSRGELRSIDVVSGSSDSSRNTSIRILTFTPSLAAPPGQPWDRLVGQPIPRSSHVIFHRRT